MAAQPPNPGVYFVLAVVSVVFLTGIAYFVLLVARWNSDRIRYVTPRVRGRPLRQEGERRFTAVSREETNTETKETAQPVAETEEEKIAFAETFAADIVARLILAEKVGLTDVVKIGYKAKSGSKYQKCSALVKEAIEREQEPEFPMLTEQRSRRSVVEKPNT